MPITTVNDHGSVLYYEDSGIPNESTNYTTLILIHGTCFHSATYHPLVPLAAQHNLRLVLLNLRGYPGSTPYSDAELAELSEDPDHALQERGVELAAFIRWFIETEHTPAPIDSVNGARTGGVAVLAWSGGNGTTLAMFAHADALPPETQELLDKHLRTLILYDPSSVAIGASTPRGFATSAAIDASLPPTSQAHHFGLQVSAFYPPFALPASLPPEPIEAVSLPRPPLAHPAPTTTAGKMSAEELAGMTHPQIFARVQPRIWAPAMRPAAQANVARALYDCRILPCPGAGAVVGEGEGKEEKAKAWPGVRAHLVWCDMTLGSVAWAAAVLRCKHAEADEGARRPLEVHTLEGANHFIHWEEPEKFIKLLAEII